MRIALAAMLAVVSLAGTAQAEPVEIGQIVTGPTYYNRPSASLAEHNADLGACARETAFSVGSDQYERSLGGAPLRLGESIAKHLIWDGPLAGVGAVRVENCMIVRGWRVVRLPERDAAALDGLPGPALVARLTPWIGAANPPGELVRTWGNEAAHPTGFKLASRAAAPGPKQLSFRIYNESGGTEALPRKIDAEPTPSAGPGVLDPKWPTKPLPSAETPLPPAGASIIVVKISGISNRYGTGIVFAREGSTPEEQPGLVDHAPGSFFAGTGFLGAKKDGNWFAFVVPAGRWRMAQSAFLSLCLGSPAFDVRPGEVVYAGAFNLAGDSLGPDLNLGPATAYLRGPGAAVVRPASYVNGSRGSCHAFPVAYALEIPGAPFETGYRWGAAAVPHP